MIPIESIDYVVILKFVDKLIAFIDSLPVGSAPLTDRGLLDIEGARFEDSHDLLD
jgi:hypothetical protein